jgi:hypothetical protein
MEKSTEKEFSWDDLQEKAGDVAKDLAYKGYKNKEEAKANMKTPTGRIVVASAAVVALITPISLFSLLGVGAVTALYFGAKKLITDSIERESTSDIASSPESEQWRIFSETEDMDVMNSLVVSPLFAQSSLHALSRNKNATPEVLSAIYAKVSQSGDVRGRTVEGSNKIKEALIGNPNTPIEIKQIILAKDNLATTPVQESTMKEDKITSLLANAEDNAEATAPPAPQW